MNTWSFKRNRFYKATQIDRKMLASKMENGSEIFECVWIKLLHLKYLMMVWHETMRTNDKMTEIWLLVGGSQSRNNQSGFVCASEFKLLCSFILHLINWKWVFQSNIISIIKPLISYYWKSTHLFLYFNKFQQFEISKF